MNLTLSPRELFDITGYKRRSKQAEWLKRNGFKFKLNKHLEPKVDREHYRAKMGLGSAGCASGWCGG